LNFSSKFNGWLGEVASDFTYENLYKVCMNLSLYYKENSTSGQKLIVGYDTRFFAKKFAEFFSVLMAEQGIKVFLSNRPAPSSVLVTSSLHKKSMGTILFTGDEFDAEHLGLRAYNDKGFLMNESDLNSFSYTPKKKFQYEKKNLKKWIAKGFVEPYDPGIIYSSFIEKTIDFSKITPTTTRVLFNPLFGSGIFYFDRILHEQNVLGYTIDREYVSDFKGIEPSPSIHFEKVYEDMVFHGAEYGFILSPDCSAFQFLIGPQRLSIQEMVYLFAERFFDKGLEGKILLSDNIKLNASVFKNFNSQFDIVSDDQFQSSLRSERYMLAIDQFGRFYFERHGAADALLCGYYLIEILNNKSLTPAKLEQKIKNVREMVL
jgi:phosphomannomutase